MFLPSISQDNQKKIMDVIMDGFKADAILYNYEEVDLHIRPMNPRELQQEQDYAEAQLNSEFGEEYEWEREDLQPQPCIDLIEMNRFEVIRAYKDKYPLLKFRKVIWWNQVAINHVALQIITNWWFEAAALTVIISNSVVLTLTDPRQSPTPTQVIIDFTFLILYTIEMSLKIIGLGFIFNQGAYLRDYWNILDFIIVSTAY